MLELNWNIVWTIVNILVLYLLLRRFLFKPVSAIMEARAKEIEDTFAQANDKNAEADSLKLQYENSLKEAKEETYRVIKSAKERAETEYVQIVDKAHDDAAGILSEANQSIEIAKQEALKRLQSEIAEMALSAASKIIGSQVEEDTNRKILDDFLNETGVEK